MYIKGWRLWLCLIVIAVTLVLLQQARRLGDEPAAAQQRWLITLTAPLNKEQQQQFAEQLMKLPVLAGQTPVIEQLSAEQPQPEN